MRLLVCGGRDYANKEYVDNVLNVFKDTYDIDLIVEGGAKGADQLAHEWAVTNKIPALRIFAEWNKHGKSAGYIRNARMLSETSPDIVIAFPGGKGTNNMIALAKKAGVKTVQLKEDSDPLSFNFNDKVNDD
jgi:hypothetical protein